MVAPLPAPHVSGTEPRQSENYSRIRDVRRLQSLRLAFTKLADVSVLAPLRHLRTLSIASTRVRDLSPLAALPQLTDLDISRNQLQSVEVLRVLMNLAQLDISMCPSLVVLDWTPLGALRRLKTLKATFFWGLPSASFLRSLTQLTTLEISPTEAGDVVDCMRCLTQLKTLKIETRPDLLALPNLSTLTQLKTLEVHETMSQVCDLTNLLS